MEPVPLVVQAQIQVILVLQPQATAAMKETEPDTLLKFLVTAGPIIAKALVRGFSKSALG